jgi:hypothetical protein
LDGLRLVELFGGEFVLGDLCKSNLRLWRGELLVNELFKLGEEGEGGLEGESAASGLKVTSRSRSTSLFEGDPS